MGTAGIPSEANPKGQTPETASRRRVGKIRDFLLNKRRGRPSKFALRKKQHHVKTIATTIAIAALALLGAAPQADARTHRSSHSSRVYISGYRSCGTPIYSERYFIGYDRCGNPIWGERVVRQSYRAPVRYQAPCPEPYYSSGYYRPSYREQSCRSGGIVIQGYFGR